MAVSGDRKTESLNKMRLRNRQKKDDAPSKVLPDCTETEVATVGSINFPKSRRRARRVERKETIDDLGSTSHLQSGSSLENMKKLRKLRKKPLPMGKGNVPLIGIEKDHQDSTAKGKSYVEEPTNTTLLTVGVGLRSCKDVPTDRKGHRNPQKKKSDQSDSLTSTEKRLRLKFNNVPCSVYLSKADIVSTMHKSQVPVVDKNQKSPCSVDESLSPQLDSEIRNCDSKKTSMYQRSHINKEEILLLLEEEVGMPEASDNDDKLAEDIQTEAIASSDSSMKSQLNKAFRSSPLETTMSPKKFYSEMCFGKKVATSAQATSTLTAWLNTAITRSESEQENINRQEHVLSASPATEELSHELVTNSRMEYQNMHTPEVRQITRLESTPQVSSESETNIEEDLFGFEKLLLPRSSLCHLVSPIPIPKLPKELKRKNKYTFFPEDNGPKAWDGLLDVTNSHLVPKKKLTKKFKHRAPLKSNDESTSTQETRSEIPESPEVNLFHVTPIECEKRGHFDEYHYDEPYNQKTKRIKPIHKTAPLTKFNFEDKLPWKDIEEHKLVIETV